ncbi:MAG: baseplate J/gp47 family protein [Pseudomonadota bacterium]|nr:baseplate J/gp47 family protein [Pseudomonadota bacterium]
MNVDFSTLAQPKMIEEIDFEALLAERKSAFLALWDDEKRPALEATLARESEPLTKLLEESCYREMILRNRINQAALSTLLAFATGTDLDNLAANFNTQRLLISAAEPSQNLSAVYESDDALRRRVLLSFEALSVAGPKQAYIYHTLSADGRVADASATSPAPAEALITVLQTDSADGTAEQALIDIVNDALNDESIRPVGDRVTVQSAEIIDYQIEAILYVERIAEHATLLAEANQRISEYAYANRRLGRSIYLSQLYALLTVGGVVRVEITSPSADILLTAEQATRCTNINVSIGS